MPRKPTALAEECDRVLIRDRALRKRVKQLGEEIHRDMPPGEFTVVALLNGAAVFTADLIRELPRPLQLDFIGLSSYADRTTAGVLKQTKALGVSVHGRNVLLVDDILDTGNTLERAVGLLRTAGAALIKTCVLLDKPSRRVVDIRADYVGFTIPDEFVVGYGLDFDHRHRNWPHIGVLKRSAAGGIP